MNITTIGGSLTTRIGIVLLSLLVFSGSAFAEEKACPSASLRSFAGEYYSGDGLGFNLRLVIRADGQFDYSWRGCMGLYAKTGGHLSLAGGLITLTPGAAGNEQPSTLAPVRWGDRLYLIEKTKFLDFCNDINMGLEPRKDMHGRAYMREGDEHKMVSGPPNLPAEWQGFLLRKPLKGNVQKMLGRYKAEINLGSEDGIKKGLILMAPNVTEVSVVSVSPHTCVAECQGVDLLPADIREKTCHLEKGQIVSSRLVDP